MVDGIDESLYGAKPPEQAPKGMDEKEKDEMHPTALIPKSLLAGKHFDEGDEVVLKIVGFHGDSEVEVEYSTEPEKGKPDKENGETKHEMNDDEQLASMNSEY